MSKDNEAAREEQNQKYFVLLPLLNKVLTGYDFSQKKMVQKEGAGTPAGVAGGPLNPLPFLPCAAGAETQFCPILKRKISLAVRKHL